LALDACADFCVVRILLRLRAAFARRANVRLLAAGPDGVHREGGDERHPVLAYAVANGHMFPVLDAAEVSCMAQFGLLRHRKPERGVGKRAIVPVVDESCACDVITVAHLPRIVVCTSYLAAVWTRMTQVGRRTLPAAIERGVFGHYEDYYSPDCMTARLPGPGQTHL
jgi:hypothetical protein